MRHLEKAVKKTFDKYDADGSGALDRDELALLLKDMCNIMHLEEFGQKKMNDILKVIDESGDGEIDFPELVRAIANVIDNLDQEDEEENQKADENQTDSKLNAINKTNPNIIKGLGRQLKVLYKLNKKKEDKEGSVAQSDEEDISVLDSPSKINSKIKKTSSCNKMELIPIENLIEKDYTVNKTRALSKNDQQLLQNARPESEDGSNTINFNDEKTPKNSSNQHPKSLQDSLNLKVKTPKKSKFGYKSEMYKKPDFAIREVTEPFGENLVEDESVVVDTPAEDNNSKTSRYDLDKQKESVTEQNSDFQKKRDAILKSFNFKQSNRLFNFDDSVIDAKEYKSIEELRESVLNYLDTLNNTDSANDMKIAIKKFLNGIESNLIVEYFDSLSYKNMVNMMNIIKIEKEKIDNISNFLRAYLKSAEQYIDNKHKETQPLLKTIDSPVKSKDFLNKVLNDNIRLNSCRVRANSDSQKQFSGLQTSRKQTASPKHYSFLDGRARCNSDNPNFTNSLPKIKTPRCIDSALISPFDYSNYDKRISQHTNLRLNTDFPANQNNSSAFPCRLLTPRNLEKVKDTLLNKSKKLTDFIDLNLNSIENKIVRSDQYQIKLPSTKRLQDLKSERNNVAQDQIKKAKKLLEKVDTSKYPGSNSFMNLQKTSISSEDKTKLKNLSKNYTPIVNKTIKHRTSLESIILKDPMDSLKLLGKDLSFIKYAKPITEHNQYYKEDNQFYGN